MPEIVKEDLLDLCRVEMQLAGTLCYQLNRKFNKHIPLLRAMRWIHELKDEKLIEVQDLPGGLQVKITEAGLRDSIRRKLASRSIESSFAAGPV